MDDRHNKKTFKKEKSRMIIDQITVTQDCAQLACELGAPCDDGDVCTVGDVIDTDCNCIGTYIDSDLLDEDFSNALGNFKAVSGAFSYSNRRYENIILQSNNVVLEVGGVDNSRRRYMSIGLGTTFNTYGSEDVFIDLDYELTAHDGYENDEWTKAIIEIDGRRVQYNGKNYLSRLVGGSPSTTGHQSISLQISGLSSGSHTLVVGLLNNKKTYRLEKSTMIIDRVSVHQDCFPSDNTFASGITKQSVNKLVDVPAIKPPSISDSGLLEISDFEDEGYDFEVFPNPTVDFININYQLKEGKRGSVKVMDLTGRVIVSKTRSGDGEMILEKINVTNWNEGIYLVVIETDNLFKTEKVIVTR